MTLIEKNDTLRLLAEQLSKDIESWYYRDYGHYILYSPMNVSLGIRGTSLRPCHQNSYIVASTLYQFSIDGIKTIDETLKRLQQFKNVTLVAPEEMRTVAIGKPCITLPKQFIPRLQNFMLGLDELKEAALSLQSNSSAAGKWPSQSFWPQEPHKKLTPITDEAKHRSTL